MTSIDEVPPMTRFLRPGSLVRSADATWLVDEAWPVAARLADVDAGSKAPRAEVVTWPWPEGSRAGPMERTVVADGIGIVVAERGQVAWVREGGSVVTHADPTLTLAAADEHTAWLIDCTYVEPTIPPNSAPVLPTGRIVVLKQDGTTTRMATPAPVRAIGLRGNDVWVCLAQTPRAIPHGPGSWGFAYPSFTVRVARRALLSDGLRDAAPAGDDVPWSSTPGPYAWTWLEDDRETVLAEGLPAGGLVWWVGTPPGADATDRPIVAGGHDPGTADVVHRVDLGRGIVSAALAVEDALWVAVARRRHLFVGRDRGVEVVAVTASGDVCSVLAPGSVDISAFAPTLHRPTDEQIREHIEQVRQSVDHLDEYWQRPDGTRRPLSDGLTDPAVSVEGTWPDGRVVLTLRHPRRRGLLLRRTLPLFEEDGSPVDHDLAAINVMEDLDTNYLPPAAEAVDGVLDI